MSGAEAENFTDGKGRAHEQTITRRAALQAAASAVAFATASPSQAQQATQATSTTIENSTIRLTVNGQQRTLSIDPRQSILDVLRETLDLTGTKKGCNAGACGACTVLVDGKRINACLALAVMHDGAEITTIEGLVNGEALHPLQQAFIDRDGFQCGYCTPGQIMSGVACIAEGHAGSPQEIKAWMSGNICRCGAYAGIVEAISEVAKEIKL